MDNQTSPVGRVLLAMEEIIVDVLGWVVAMIVGESGIVALVVMIGLSSLKSGVLIFDCLSVLVLLKIVGISALFPREGVGVSALCSGVAAVLSLFSREVEALLDSREVTIVLV